MDTSYNRVLIFKNAGTLPEGTTGTTGADIVLGQDTFDAQAIGAGMKQMNNPGVFGEPGIKSLWQTPATIVLFSPPQPSLTTLTEKASQPMWSWEEGGFENARNVFNTLEATRRCLFRWDPSFSVSDTNNHRILYWFSHSHNKQHTRGRYFWPAQFHDGRYSSC